MQTYKTFIVRNEAYHHLPQKLLSARGKAGPRSGALIPPPLVLRLSLICFAIVATWQQLT